MTSIRPDNNDEHILSFWTWFCAVAADLAKDFENDPLLTELDARVSAMGDISWEIGPGAEKECALTLSPDGSHDWFTLTQRAVAMAPELPAWEFHSARQKKEWKLQFSMAVADGRVVNVDARPWRYVLLRFPDGSLEIIIEQSNLIGIDEDSRYTAAVIVLDGILGEALRLLSLKYITPVQALDSKESSKANPMGVLAGQLLRETDWSV